MERLTIREVIEHCKRHTERIEKHSSRMQLEETPIGNSDFMKQYWEHRQVAEWLKELQLFKDKEEQGLLISLPCKVGDKVYQIGNGWYQVGTDICEFVVTAITISKGKIIISVENENKMGFPVSIDCIGKRLYLTRFEAEEALEKMGGK